MSNVYQQVDFGLAARRDPRTGDVYVDEDGNIPSVEGGDLVIQEAVVALKTIKGEEVFDSEYGLDIFGIFENPDNLSSKYLIVNAIEECLDTDRIPQIQEVNVLEVSEQTNSEYYVTINIITANGENKVLGMDLDSGEDEEE